MCKYELFAQYEGSPKVYTAARYLGLQNSEDEKKTSATNNRIVQVTSFTILGVVIDDPSDVEEIIYIYLKNTTPF